MSRELGAHGICVNTLAPGYTISGVQNAGACRASREAAAIAAAGASSATRCPEDLLGTLVYPVPRRTAIS